MSEQPPPLARSLRGLAATLLGLAQVRLELLSVEAREEALRLGEILLYGAIALTMLSVGVAFFAIFLTVLTINFIGDGLRDALDPRRVL